MTEFSGMWTTSGTPSGDQQVSYTQAQLSTAFEIIAAANNFEGVAANFLNEYNPTDGGSETANIASGGSMVDGKYHRNGSTLGVNIPAAVGGGNTRIDRIVLRANWSAFTIRIFRIAGTDAASPSAPSITQTSGSTYDIMICQVLVDTGGDVTVTDERIWATPDVDDSTIEISALGRIRLKAGGILASHISSNAVDTAELVADAVTGAKIENDAIDSEHYVDGSIDKIHLAADSVDGSKIEDDAIDSEHYADGSIDLAHLANDSVDDTKVGDRVIQLYRRQGGDSNQWNVGGTANWAPGAVRMFVGAKQWSGSATSGSISITFPTSFDFSPVVFPSFYGAIGHISFNIAGVGLSTCTIEWKSESTEDQIQIFWIAIGTE